MTPLFIRTESFQQFIRYYPIVTWLVGINTVIFVLTFLLPSTFPPPFHNVINYWAVGWNDAVAAGQYWRLVTPIFLHGGAGHFIFNSFALIIFGPALERILGHLKFTGLYLFAGIIGNVGTFLFEGGSYLHLGASGAIYGLLGLYLYMRFFRKDLIDAGSAQTITTILIIGVIYTFVMPNINILGHLFGFIGGAILGPVIFLGKVKYFTMVNTPKYRSRVVDDEHVGFDPDRWNKVRKRKTMTKYVFYGVLIFLILMGIISQIFN